MALDDLSKSICIDIYRGSHIKGITTEWKLYTISKIMESSPTELGRQ
jgi:hypothetical protein